MSHCHLDDKSFLIRLNRMKDLWEFRFCYQFQCNDNKCAKS